MGPQTKGKPSEDHDGLPSLRIRKTNSPLDDSTYFLLFHSLSFLNKTLFWFYLVKSELQNITEIEITQLVPKNILEFVGIEKFQHISFLVLTNPHTPEDNHSYVEMKSHSMTMSTTGYSLLYPITAIISSNTISEDEIACSIMFNKERESTD